MSRFEKRDLLYLLKLEASIIEGGGYGRPVMMAWRDVTIMSDCITCLNVAGLQERHSCGGCFLLDQVPDVHKQENIPCHYIPLNEVGDSIASLDQQGRRKDAERALLKWIKTTIKKLEQEPD